MKDFLAGDTMKILWTNSGVTPDSLNASIIDGDETLIHSADMVNSGDGHYYAYAQVSSTPGFYVAETNATISGMPFRRRVRFKTILLEVD